MMNTDIRNALTALIRSTDDDAIDRNADALADAIIKHARTLRRQDADAIMSAVRLFDPAEWTCAAYIRDTIRDNTDFDLTR